MVKRQYDGIVQVDWMAQHFPHRIVSRFHARNKMFRLHIIISFCRYVGIRIASTVRENAMLLVSSVGDSFAVTVRTSNHFRFHFNQIMCVRGTSLAQCTVLTLNGWTPRSTDVNAITSQQQRKRLNIKTTKYQNSAEQKEIEIKCELKLLLCCCDLWLYELRGNWCQLASDRLVRTNCGITQAHTRHTH